MDTRYHGSLYKCLLQLLNPDTRIQLFRGEDAFHLAWKITKQPIYIANLPSQHRGSKSRSIGFTLSLQWVRHDFRCSVFLCLFNVDANPIYLVGGQIPVQSVASISRISCPSMLRSRRTHRSTRQISKMKTIIIRRVISPLK